ncbi:hypothetical protein BDW74DRAFT_146035 [Aspergillus multicolor]|uniref:uncharacterized protein n=1 Tax=Aspergillus multicolor TaxID=41759 RepID=UPI003CCCFBD3
MPCSNCQTKNIHMQFFLPTYECGYCKCQWTSTVRIGACLHPATPPTPVMLYLTSSPVSVSAVSIEIGMGIGPVTGLEIRLSLPTPWSERAVDYCCVTQGV